MKRRIIIDVDVNDDSHADLIYDEIVAAVRMRTTVFQTKFDNEYEEIIV